MTPVIGHPLNSMLPGPDDEPPAKRQKTIACSRCRKRKQKCDDQRPCANCQRSGEECTEVQQPATSGGNSVAGVPVHVAWTPDIPSLEERIARLERSQALERPRRSTGYDNVPDTYYFNGYQNPGASCEDGNNRLQPATRHESAVSLNRGSPVVGLLAAFARSEADYWPRGTIHSPVNARDEGFSQAFGQGLNDEPNGPPPMAPFSEAVLFDIYAGKIHSRYPFLRLDHLRDPAKRPSEYWVGYFLNMIYSIGLLLAKNSEIDIPREKNKEYHRLAVTRYLSHVFAQPDRLLHIQAYLLLAMHALYSPSTERIVSIASATMRYCVLAQLHLASAEPDLVDAETKIQVQTRRRVFWSAYALDRAVGTMFDLPFSIPDYQITVRVYANIDDADLDEKCRLSFPDDPASHPGHTSVSAALHVVFCRQIQSEILNTTLHRDFATKFESQSNWRLQILEKLERWKSLCHRYSDPRSRAEDGSEYTKSEWLQMVYNYSLAMLYRPTRQSATGPAGDWTVKSCVQACLIFRKFQKDTATMTEAWMALIAQFKSGIALLYCFFATPPQLRSATYKSPDVSEAIRACSIILALIAERWPQTRCLRDTFDLLAREIPIIQPDATSDHSESRRIHHDATTALLESFNQLELLVVHRDTLRMIKEMATEEFARVGGDELQTRLGTEPGAEADGARHHPPDNDTSSQHTTMTGDIFQPITPYFLLPELPGQQDHEFDYADLGFPGIF
ncbi:fungal-specific transcription factor domain-containing protein [Xylariales sp. PMI_506]|nr:fungal-specific transcription factor domain-containing protein [Xylariales sp. PMI_506]